MTGLYMKLAPYERFFVNGALIANGDRRGRINVITSDAIVMRESSIVTPDLAETELSRLVMLAQTALFGRIDRDCAMNSFKELHMQIPHEQSECISRHLLEASISHKNGDLRGIYISLERAYRIEARSTAK
jgi:flagellar biosynthesis regulator FlbT